MQAPRFVERDGHRTWLKWHRARRRAGDPVFTCSRVLEALQVGASVEVDLVAHGGGGFAVLHNFDLDEETTGSGAVRSTPPEVLRGLHLRNDPGAPLPDRVMLLEDLCALLRERPPHPEALLQLDLKEDAPAITPEVVAAFARAVGPVAGSMILSGGDAAAVDALVRATPALRSGYDPCHGASLARLQATGDFRAFISAGLRAAPGAEIIYLDYRLVLAADAAGVDLIAACHAAGRRVDAWTIPAVTDTTLAAVARLLELRVDQITTDDPEGLALALERTAA